MTEPLLRVTNLSLKFRGQPVLTDLSFDLLKGTLTAILGPSGVGKTTLLRCLNRLVDEDDTAERTGKIYFKHHDIDNSQIEVSWLRQRIGIVLQRPTMFPLSIFENVIFAVKHLKLAPKSEWLSLAEKYLRESFLWDEVAGRLHSPARELSLGQQQRLAIARTLALEPDILLMDEPTASLDDASTEKIEDLIHCLKKDRGIVLVTHRIEQAKRLADTLVTLTPARLPHITVD